VGLTVAVTGPTGDIGRSTIRALEREPEIERIVGMARRPFDPALHGWERTEYVRGDILDPSSVKQLVEGADVVVHLAFVIFGNRAETRRTNLEGSRAVFEAAVEAGVKRLVYTSSVAAYGFHEENPQPLTEETEPRGSEGFYYSAQKAELESALREAVAGSSTDAYVFRPSIVAGEDALAMIEQIFKSEPLGTMRRVADLLPGVPFILPAPGVPFQLVHHDDVADAIGAAVLGRGEPGVYNLAAPGTITAADLARAMGWRRIPIPRQAIKVGAAAITKAPLMPAQTQWLKAFSIPVVMDCSKAARQLGWEPRFDTAQTLRETIRGAKTQSRR
jgi:nucleoside-diphosphate-sugar epimerase